MVDAAAPLSSKRPVLSSPAKKRKLSDSEAASPTSTDEVDPTSPEEGTISPKKKARRGRPEQVGGPHELGGTGRGAQGRQRRQAAAAVRAHCVVGGTRPALGRGAAHPAVLHGCVSFPLQSPQPTTTNSTGAALVQSPSPTVMSTAVGSPARAPHTLYQDGEYGTKLHVDEATIVHGALDLATKTVTAVMIPMKQVYMLEIDTELNHDVMANILASNHSRIPVCEDHKSNIVGLLLVRLIVLDPDDARPLHDLVNRGRPALWQQQRT